MAAEVYLRDNLAQWRKAKEFYFHDGNEWRNIQEAYSYDGASWRKVFQYTAPSSLPSNPTGPIRPDVVASSGTYVSTPLTPNNSKDTSNAVVDTATFGEWRVEGQTGNTVIWTWASGSNSYSTISLNVRLAVSNLKTATTPGESECASYAWGAPPSYEPYCVEYRPSTTLASPATIVFSYSLNGSTYTDFYTYSSLISETADGTISSGDITSGLGSVNSDLSNLKVKAAISCPTGASSNASANLKVYDVWANTVAGASAVPPTVTFTASSSNVPNGTSVNLVSTFSRNGGATITSASINQGVGSIGTSSPVTTAVTPASTATTTYTLTVTDSNSNTTTKQVSVNAYAAGASGPHINLGSGNEQSKSVQLGTSVNLTATWSPGTAGQSVVSVTSGSAAGAGLASPWTPSGSPGYRTLDPTAEGIYTITNTLNGSTPSAYAVLTVTAPVMASIAIQQYYPSSSLAIKPATIYTDDDGTTFGSTSLKIWADYYGTGVQGVVKAQWQSSPNNSTWSDLGAQITTGVLPVTEKVVNGEGYYRCVFTNTYPGSSAIATTTSDSFYVSPRYRYKPNPAIYRSVDSIATITRANPGVITLNQLNPNLDGKSAVLRNITGMTQLNNQTVTLTDIGSGLSTGRAYSIGVNTSGYNDFDYSAGAAIVESISSWDSNGYTVDWKPISGISGTTITTSSAHGFSNGQKVLFTNIVGASELNSKLLTISSADTHTFQVTFSGYIGAYVSGGYAIGADTPSSAVSTNIASLSDLSTNSEEYITITKTGLIKFPSISAFSAKIFIRAGWTYDGFAFKNSMNDVYRQFGIHDGAPTGQRLSMTLLKNGQGVTDLLNVLIPKDPDNGSSPESPWSETIVGSNYTHIVEGLTNLNEISIEINAISSKYDRSFEDMDDPPDSHSGQINVYDVYVIYDKVSTVTNVDSDKIFP